MSHTKDDLQYTLKSRIIYEDFHLNIHFTATKRPYKFAWEDDDLEVKSDITVSSVHTSDLSEFEDDFSTESELEYSDLTDHGNDSEEEEEEIEDRIEATRAKNMEDAPEVTSKIEDVLLEDNVPSDGRFRIRSEKCEKKNPHEITGKFQ